MNCGRGADPASPLARTQFVDKSVHSIAAPCVFDQRILLVVIEPAQTQPYFRVQANADSSTGKNVDI
jgi:hypothetical protein